MLDKDNIIITSILEAVEKIPADEKDYRKCSFIVYFAQPQQLQRVDQHIANSRNSCLPTRIHPVYLKKSLKTFYTEKGVITGTWLVLSTLDTSRYRYRFSGNQLADARGGG